MDLWTERGTIKSRTRNIGTELHTSREMSWWLRQKGLTNHVPHSSSYGRPVFDVRSRRIKMDASLPNAKDENKSWMANRELGKNSVVGSVKDELQGPLFLEWPLPLCVVWTQGLTSSCQKVAEVRAVNPALGIVFLTCSLWWSQWRCPDLF